MHMKPLKVDFYCSSICENLTNDRIMLQNYSSSLRENMPYFVFAGENLNGFCHKHRD